MKKAAIAGLVIVGVIGAAIAASAAVYYTQPKVTERTPETREIRLNALLGNDEARMNDPQWVAHANAIIDTENKPDALLLIVSDTSWQGAKQGSDFVQESVAGSGFTTYVLACEPNGIGARLPILR